MKTEQDYLDDLNNLHKECVKIDRENADYRNNRVADYCEEMILKAKDAYYNSGEAIMCDNAYDRFENYLKILRPDSKVLEQVGSSNE